MGPLFAKILESNSHSICVIAAPGSGKTSRILIPKAKQILALDGVDPRQVLLLTFSRLSALDLKKRVETMEHVPRASTVHSFCLSFLLSEDNHDIRRRVESILMDFEKDVLLWDLKVVFPKKHKTDLQKQLEEFSAGWATEPHGRVFEETEERRAFKYAITNWLAEHQAAMMEEVVYNAVDLARKLNDPQFIAELKYIFVDEFQDLNKLEQEFIEILAKDSKLLLVVGDPNQSIYFFKFAYPEGICEFAKRPEVETYSSLVSGRCPKRVVGIANQLLRQADPGRTDLIEAAASAEEGEVHFVCKETQSEELHHILNSISMRLHSGATADSIIVLSPRRKLAEHFAEYANDNASAAGVSSEIRFVFVMKPEFSHPEKQKILLFGLWVKPDSLLHSRTYVGLNDESSFATELHQLKVKYGGLTNALRKARPEDFPNRSKRVRALCERIQELNGFISSHPPAAPLDKVLAELFPEADPQVTTLREILLSLGEESDTPKALYAKLLDYIRTVPHSSNTIRVMTLRGCKGLEADHIYIVGCNAGNIPGKKWSIGISDFQHEQEQRRLLYVALTRAKKSATFSWSRFLPFGQARGHYTSSVRTITRNGERFSQVGISKFLQDLSGIQWDH